MNRNLFIWKQRVDLPLRVQAWASVVPDYAFWLDGRTELPVMFTRHTMNLALFEVNVVKMLH